MRTVKGTRISQLKGFGLGALALGLVAGCEGGQTGDLSGSNDGSGTEANSGGCDEHKQKLASFDEPTDAGSANQLLAIAEGQFDAPLTWKAPSTGQAWSVGPESGQGQVHVEVTRGQSAYLLTYSPHEQSGSGPAIDIGVICPPTQLGVEAHVEVTTDGGALNESYDTLLRSATAGVAQLSVPFDPTKVSGELSVASSNPQAKLVQLRLGATLTAEGMTGSLAGIEQTTFGTGPDSAVSGSGAVLAVWPDSEACRGFFQDGGGLGIGIEDEALGATGEATLAALAPTSPQSITWKNGDQTTLSIGIEASGDGCFRVRDDLPLELGGGPSASYPVIISLKSADGRLDGAYPGKVIATGVGAARSVVAEAALTLAVDEADQSGFSPVDVPSSADSLILRVEATLEAGVATGSVRLVALTDPDCPSQPAPSSGGSSPGSGAQGCPGQTQTPIESASWSH
jgi:hypothetical protein